MRIEKFLFWKIELWVLLLVALVMAIVSVLLGWAVLERASNDTAGGPAGDAAMAVAGFPQTVRRVIKGETDYHKVKDRFAKARGFHFYGKIPDPNYILVNRYDGDGRHSVSELYREGATSPIHVWKFDQVRPYEFKIKNPLLQKQVSSDSASRRMMHAIMTPDGGLIFHFEQGAPLYKMNSCGAVVWLNNDFAYHHSIESDEQGNFWASANSLKPTKKLEYDDRFHDDYIVKVSPSGKTLFSKSILDLLIENELENRVYTYDRYERDPFHVNDIQPVVHDGPHWRKGDVFISLGHLNMLLLYRPSTDQLIWWTQDKVVHQHDIDIVDDHRIMVFNNNRVARAEANIVIGHNEPLFYDFRSRQFSSPFKPAFEKFDIRTVSQGLAELTKAGGLFVEETDQGRILMLSPSHELQWEFINKDKSGETYSVNWSRYLPADDVKPVLSQLGRAKC